jgi:putative spermidine/putrescine transport system ATP-binding protein
MAEVRVEGLSKAYGPVKALDGVTLTFPDGGFFGLLGPSGSGKTTLLRAVAGFVAPDAGRVLIDGPPVEDVPVERREIGMVFQSYALFPHMSVAENVGFGLRVRGVRGSAAAARVAEALDLVRLGDLGARKPAELSGGQRQRVSMARAIAPRPRVLLLDEPLSALDASLRQEMQVELKRIQREVGITTVFVTHDQEEALTLSDRIGLLRDGRLMREGPPREVYRDPRTTFVARFLGEANVLEGAPDPAGLRLADGTLIPLPRPAARIALRPEDLRVTPLPPPEGPMLRAELRGRVFAGATGACLLERDGARLRATGPDRAFADLPETGLVWVSWAQADALPLED